jgi:hypothetical protein
MGDLTLLIIRHAEKPNAGSAESGLTENGAPDSESLVIRGWQRAGAWAALLGAGLGGPDYPKPDAIFAAEQGPADILNQPPSRRPAETVSPLAARLGKTVDESFAKGKEKELVAKLLTLSGVVLVAWEHEAIIADILPRLPVGQGTPPTHWPGQRFDVVLRFDRPAGETTFAYRPLYPELLSGDSRGPLDG